MKTIKLLISLIAILGFSSVAISQTSFNMHQLQHLDPHPYVNGNSIGCLGYVQNGREYCLFACNGGTSFIDVTDSANIHEVAFLSAQYYSNWRDFKTYQHYVYIVNDVGGGMQIADLQYLPDSVHLISVYTFTGFTRAHTIEQSGPYLYLNGGNYSNEGVVVLDISADPTLPVKRGQWETDYIHDERIVNDTLYGCSIYDGKMYVIDATNKDSLTTITSWMNGPGPMPHNCAFSQNRRYLYTTDEILAPVGHLKIWDMQNLFNPVLVYTWIPVGCDSSNVHNIEVYGDTAYICHYTAGVRILDISNPTLPVEVAWFDTYPQNNGTTWNGCKGIYKLPSGKILANDKQTGFYCLKLGNPIGINNNSGTVPTHFSLEQNYPNPFNPTTNIEFSVPKTTNISLIIYDIRGRVVSKLLDGAIYEGHHRITYDAAALSSGIYFYTLSTAEFTQTRKMILIK